MSILRTIAMFIYLFGYMNLHYGILRRAERAAAAGDTATVEQIVNQHIPRWSRGILKVTGVSLLVDGLENIPKDRPCVFVANHRSYYDIPLLLAGLELKAGRFEKAAERFAAAAQAATGEESLDVRARAYFGLGEAAEAAGQPDKAARHFMSVAVLFDDPEWTPHSLFRAGQLFGQAGKKSEQAGAWSELKARYPESGFAKQVEGISP